MTRLDQRLGLWMVALVWVILGVACAPVEETAVPATHAENAGEAAPSSILALTTLTGETLDLADYRGQVVLVNFWATWCAPCRIEMPELDSYLQAHAADGFALLAVNAGEPAARAAAYLAEFDYTFTVILDGDGRIDDYFGGVRGMPTSYVLNGEGDIVYQHVGVLTQALLDENITLLLSAQGE